MEDVLNLTYRQLASLVKAIIKREESRLKIQAQMLGAKIEKKESSAKQAKPNAIESDKRHQAFAARIAKRAIDGRSKT